MLEAYGLADELIAETERRRVAAASELELQDSDMAKQFLAFLNSSSAQMGKADATHSGAVSDVERVAQAVRTKSKSSGSEDSYQAVHNVVTETVFTVLEVVAITSNTIEACEANAAAGGQPCDPGVLATAQPILDLDPLAMAALPNTAGAS